MASDQEAGASRLTSFGFLREDNDTTEGQYGIGQLLSKVKTVFSGGTASSGLGEEKSQPAQQPSAVAPAPPDAIVGGTTGPQGSQRVPAEPRSSTTDSVATGDTLERGSVPGAHSTGAPALGSTTTALNGSEAHTSQKNNKIAREVSTPKDIPVMKATAPRIPAALRTTTAAPAVTSLAPTVAIAQQGGISINVTEHDDTQSLFSPVEDSYLSSDRLGSKRSFATLVSHIRLPSTAIPGFPLSKELLADDAQSSWSVSSRSPGSDSGPDHIYGSSTSTSLQTSAEAFRRLTMRGGAAHSKEWWMPDESAKECSACGNPFGIARRRHHCRCCGQIFCSKCASNLLPGAKLGLPGVVRVCHFCTRMMKQYDLARATGHSGASDGPMANNNVRVRAEMISAPLEAAVENAPQSRFAANALFSASPYGRIGSESPTEHFSSQSIFKPSIQTASSTESVNYHPSRSQTPEPPANSLESLPTTLVSSSIEAQTPFRRGLGEEDQAIESEPTVDDAGVDTTSRSTDLRESSVSPLLQPPSLNDAEVSGARKAPAPSSIVFPSSNQGSPSKAVARDALSQARARLASDASISQESRARLVSDAAIRAFRRSRLRTRITTSESLPDKCSPHFRGTREDGFLTESRPSSRLGSSHSAQTLGSHSLMYLQQLLHQCLTRSEIANKEQWMAILLPLALRVIQSVRPDPLSRGKSMGVRRLVKIKRIPGGSPQDSHAMDGYICSRNVASKAMVRRLPLHNPRVALLSFPLTAVKGEGQYVSLDALTASEREYTRILVARVLALRPHLLIVRDQVSRLALDILEQAGIVVVWKVPESSMSAIARVTQSDIITSVDRLALQPRLGRCGLFAVDMYRSILLPGRRRSFLRFTDTPKELGCSIILRGGGQALLGTIKSILEFCLLAAHNLRLEESMRNVDLALLPEPLETHCALHSEQDNGQRVEDRIDNASTSPLEVGRTEDDDTALAEAVDSRVGRALQDYRSTLLSISARLEIPPPYPLLRLKNEQAVLNKLKDELEQSDKSNAGSGSIALRSSHSSTSLEKTNNVDDPASCDAEGDDVKTPTLESGTTQEVQSGTQDVSPLVPDTAGEKSVPQDPQNIVDPDNSPLALDETMDVEKQVQAMLPSSATMSLQTRFAIARSRHSFDMKFLPSLLDIGKDGLTPFPHQHLTVLHSFISSATLKPCIGPRIEQMEYYGKDDHTLGNFLDSKCVSSSQVCKAKSCGLQEILHFDSFIHHQTRVQCFCERFVCPIAGQELSILTWEYCKVCETATPVSVVDEVAKAYSWSKFMEAHFYTRKTRSSCSHELLVDRIRYFAYKNLAFRIHVEQVDPFDVVVPGLRLFMRPDIQSTLKTEESLGFARRADAYFHSVGARLKALETEIASCQDILVATERYRPQLLELKSFALSGRREVNKLFVDEVAASGPGDTLWLNKVRQKLQGIVVKVDEHFLRLEKLVLPKEKDLRRMNANHLGRLFVEKDLLERTPEVPDRTEPAIAACESELSGTEGLPHSHTSTSLSALVRVADSAAFGLPTHLGLSFDEATPLPSETTSVVPSGTTTPTTIETGSHAKVAPAASSQAATASSSPVEKTTGLVASIVEQFSPTTSLIDMSDAVSPPNKKINIKGPEDSDGFSSPTDRLRPLSRPKGRKGKSPSSFGSTVTDSSCTEAGESTDGSRLAGSLATRLEPLSKAASKINKSNLPERAASNVPRNVRQQVLSDGEVRSLSRPTSPVEKQLRGHPNFARTQSSSAVEQRSSHAKAGSKPILRSGLPPPSSYKPPSTRGAVRASESESDAPGAKGPYQHRQRVGVSSFTASRPPMSRRTSAKSDSGNESQTLKPVHSRSVRRSGTGSTHLTSLPPVAVPRTPSRIPLAAAVGGGAGRVSTIARHFDRINRHAEKEREKQRRALALRARRALPIAASSARIAEYTSVSAAVESDESSEEENDDDDEEGADSSSKSDGGEADSEAEAELPGQPCGDVGASLDDRPGMTSGVDEQKEAARGEAPDAPPTEQAGVAADKREPAGLKGREGQVTPSGEASGLERGSLLKTISSFWASRAGIALPLLEYPLSSEQHLFADSPLLLREDEPSSTIAFTLVSAKYQERVRHLRASRKSAHTTLQDPDLSTASWGIVDHRTEDEEVESSLRRPEGVHLRFDFESGASKFHCRILFSEQFDALRRCCGCEESFIMSLARCLKWDSSGGKSGMTFLKTRDDRLVLKQLSTSEMTSFSTFAPHYFAHMADCLMHGKPTTLAKIFGLFRISMRNQATGKSYKLDVVVMEHLFYGRRCSRIFDLKGSMRNRYVKETGAPGEVLQDENLVEISLQRPLFIREGSKVMLRQALMHDSQFLAEMNIMDYSVIVGIDTSDEENHELVVGIIDFLRSYTWDKRVETFVKEQSSLLGAAKGELPTVITPKQYATRFLNFLDGILLLSPDAWYQGTSQGPSPHSSGNSNGASTMPSAAGATQMSQS